MDKIEISKRNMVIVQRMSFSDTSTCHVKTCKKHDVYAIFVGEYPRLSNLSFSCCAAHLPLFVNRAVKESQKYIRDTIARQKRDERKAAKILLKIA